MMKTKLDFTQHQSFSDIVECRALFHQIVTAKLKQDKTDDWQRKEYFGTVHDKIERSYDSKDFVLIPVNGRGGDFDDLFCVRLFNWKFIKMDSIIAVATAAKARDEARTAAVETAAEIKKGTKIKDSKKRKWYY